MAMAKAKSSALSVADKCRNILGASWEAHLNTIKADATGSKGEIYTSRVHYMIQKGMPYLIVPGNHMHNINIIIDERGSLSVSSPVPGRLTSLLKSLNKLPPRVAMTGDVLRMKETKVPVIADSLKKAILKEHKAASEATYGVSAVLSSASSTCRSRSEGLLSLLNEESSYSIYKFEIGSCVYIDSSGSNHNIELDTFEPPKADLLLPFAAKLIDGINRSESRRRALMLFCFEYFDVTARDALLLSIDHHGFDVLAKLPEREITALDVPQQYHWKEFRFPFKEAAKDVEDFCRMLVELEQEALHSVKSYSGLG
ncbi:uncharacterized protein LOC100828530 [Brachypodium distachyon]|uniref:CREG-like beta-barrel domain-containing protein n=1 Tax=Brachypodium distachyon TaxID=15368 RepID=I1H6Y2_BRADI|nr:uncharacterized protein LOC100828530 [Brachypodium distachyon]KQK22334.1 hypothetical protein BRADI_1g66580v3 [Brachypodium distachyon]|eukprot:XP_003558230.1 uncharacterized protein LOC100828530 [Brachypodium distachyon]